MVVVAPPGITLQCKLRHPTGQKEVSKNGFNQSRESNVTMMNSQTNEGGLYHMHINPV